MTAAETSTWQQYVDEARRDQAEALYQSLVREGRLQADGREGTLLDTLDTLPRREALARLAGDLAPGVPSPVPADLSSALADSIRRLDPETFGAAPTIVLD
ncbi:MAG: hypothetical protein QOG52_2698 [Frankiaceae bacterium]|jgi:hypothetical protein|nr:hypothetical protein [Frankiaceae bacterium]MDQ1725670.1 hypothetical protein [Frankiaceae bacterium]